MLTALAVGIALALAGAPRVRAARASTGPARPRRVHVQLPAEHRRVAAPTIARAAGKVLALSDHVSDRAHSRQTAPVVVEGGESPGLADRLKSVRKRASRLIACQRLSMLRARRLYTQRGCFAVAATGIVRPSPNTEPPANDKKETHPSAAGAARTPMLGSTPTNPGPTPVRPRSTPASVRLMSDRTHI